MSFIRHLCYVLALTSAAPALHAARSEAQVSPRATVALLSATDVAAPGQTLDLGLHFRFQPGWHIYWMNPGDAGQAPRIEVFAPAGSVLGEVSWPAPERHVDGPITTFVHQGEVLLPFTVTLPPALAGTAALSVKANWLVCKDICIPEEGVFRLELPAGTAQDSPDAALFEAARAALPTRSEWRATVDAQCVLTLEGTDAGSLQAADFFPADWGRVEHGAAQTLNTAGDVARIVLKPGPDFDSAKALEGVLRVRGGDGIERALWVATPGEPPVRTSVLSLAAADALPPAAPASPVAAPADEGVLWPLLFAFAGGLLLNLMPCVFPVLAIKALSFARMGGDRAAAVRLQSLAYCAGVVASFLLLAALLLALRAAGSQAGWGFQFQSPVFVAAMATLLFGIGLNLSGVFDIGVRLASAGESLASRGGLAGSFFTGVLAVVVATPCTAPFMGGAIAAALGAPAPVTVGIFVALGLGMALPYLLFAFFPATAAHMPRPGAWMDRLKQALAFPMYGAAAWLVWVLSQQSGADGVLHVLAALLLVALAAWLFGVAQRGAARAWSWRGAAALALLAGLLALGRTPEPVATTAVAQQAESAYSAQRLADLRAAGRPVFVNMTAAWCVTCLMNEKVALSTDVVQRAFVDRGVVYLKGDWTRADPDITRFLQSHGRDGVPLYVYYAPGREGVVLPQILTPQIVLDHIAS
ncbi:MAG: protein-disulfide reductase DsbD family protein [Methyloversatilis sp.]|uniref:protein-disulfide reductase DsbD family protein n=1 Tax=Methyloversatilis sp. TaxID=2569862 RepID=UPI0025D450E4|nr:protein-disulfide reductase DsbD domain-containing protein [Methyloversatilis sp.]MCR6666859.1 protein-disulfide reductase DsbD family protein [Methyloversatilis sp.]